MLNAVYLVSSLFIGLWLCYVLWQRWQTQQLRQALAELVKQFQEITIRFAERESMLTAMRDNMTSLLKEQQQEMQQQRVSFQEHQFKSLQSLQASVQQAVGGVSQQVAQALSNHADLLSKQVAQLTQMTEKKLENMSGQVEKRLTEGFQKTTATFADVVQRLSLIDEAQKKITELSTNVVSLQEILADKRSRGAFGEVQLSALIHNVLPANQFALQYTLKNDKRADCILFLPEPTGNIVIDAKFPLENYRRATAAQISTAERNEATTQFRRDIQKHIQDIASKYIVAGETADGAVMFIPAEAVFAEIHAHYADLVEYAQQRHVWLASPTTMMAILTTARAVIKDAATRQQVHLIQEHLGYLHKDFARFQDRMEKLATHIRQAHEDVENVKTSSKKITARFNQIERVELAGQEPGREPLLSAVDLEGGSSDDASLSESEEESVNHLEEDTVQ